MTTTSCDVVILGAGPAGSAAALEAKSLGLDVVLLDEAERPGGQIYRAPALAAGAEDHGPGEILRTGIETSGIDYRPSSRVWLLEAGYRTYFTAAGNEADTVRSRAVILATGAIERVAPVPGWTLPGVFGLAAATTLIKAEAMLPGETVVVAGRGPLLLLVATLIIAAGGKVAAVIDANPASRWIAKVPALASRPDLVAQGAGWLAQVIAHRVPIHFSSRITRCHGDDRVTGVTVVSGRVMRTLACDAVCLGHGLAPSTDISRLLGVEHRFDVTTGGWSLATDRNGRTPQAGLYACGDGAGVLGVGAAPLRGRLAAIAAAHDLCLLEGAEARALPVRRKLAKAARFGAAMTALGPPGVHQVADADDDTIICRCEGIRRITIDAAIDAGAQSLDAVKAATRCGMGPCAARYCGESAAALIAVRTGRSLLELGQMSGRPPLRPLPLGTVMEDFDYADIPFPEPAPL